jgi:N-acetylglucosaminyldiphosphoundecaprenol N-acetyl-beta-D-mannosaminyltransferase
VAEASSAATCAVPVRRHVLGCPIDSITLEGAVARVDRAIARKRPLQHVAINAAKVVQLQHDVTLRHAVATCELSTADGTAVVWASRVLGHPLPERVAGIDLMEAVLDLAGRRGYRVYLLGARPHVVVAASETIRARHPGIQIAGWHHGYFAHDEREAIVDEIRKADPQILLVALESPAKELFLEWARAQVSVAFAMGVGGAFDILAGERRRAPYWMQRAGLEWLYRLRQEPRRLARRYFVGNAQFTWLVLREAAHRIARRSTGLEPRRQT